MQQTKAKARPNGRTPCVFSARCLSGLPTGGARGARLSDFLGKKPAKKEIQAMKIMLKHIVANSVILMTVLFNAHATTNVSLSIDSGINVALHWPSETNQAFIIGCRTTLNAATPWMLMTNVVAATNNVQTDYINQGAIASNSTGFYVVSEFAEDFDGDGVDNGTELILETDPFVIDNVSDASYPAAPSVYFGEVVFNYDTNSGTAPKLGPFLYANPVVANTMVTTEPTPGELHLKWTSAVLIILAFSLFR